MSKLSKDEQIKLLREALEEIQWKAELGFWEEGGCSECYVHGPPFESEHKPDCIVGKALKEST